MDSNKRALYKNGLFKSPKGDDGGIHDHLIDFETSLSYLGDVSKSDCEKFETILLHYSNCFMDTALNKTMKFHSKTNERNTPLYFILSLSFYAQLIACPLVVAFRSSKQKSGSHSWLYNIHVDPGRHEHLKEFLDMPKEIIQEKGDTPKVFEANKIYMMDKTRIMWRNDSSESNIARFKSIADTLHKRGDQFINYLCEKIQYPFGDDNSSKAGELFEKATNMQGDMKMECIYKVAKDLGVAIPSTKFTTTTQRFKSLDVESPQQLQEHKARKVHRSDSFQPVLAGNVYTTGNTKERRTSRVNDETDEIEYTHYTPGFFKVKNMLHFMQHKNQDKMSVDMRSRTRNMMDAIVDAVAILGLDMIVFAGPKGSGNRGKTHLPASVHLAMPVDVPKEKGRKATGVRGVKLFVPSFAITSPEDVKKVGKSQAELFNKYFNKDGRHVKNDPVHATRMGGSLSASAITTYLKLIKGLPNALHAEDYSNLRLYCSSIITAMNSIDFVEDVDEIVEDSDDGTNESSEESDSGGSDEDTDAVEYIAEGTNESSEESDSGGIDEDTDGGHSDDDRQNGLANSPVPLQDGLAVLPVASLQQIGSDNNDAREWVVTNPNHFDFF